MGGLGRPRVRQYINPDDRIIPFKEVERRIGFIGDSVRCTNILLLNVPIVSRAGMYIAQMPLLALFAPEFNSLAENWKGIISPQRVMRALRFDSATADLRLAIDQFSRARAPSGCDHPQRAEPEDLDVRCAQCSRQKPIWDFAAASKPKTRYVDFFGIPWTPERASECLECVAATENLIANGILLRALAPGSHTKNEWLAILNRFGRRCLRCGSTERITKDHVKPLARGGSDNADNLQPLCQRCNSWKHTKTIDFRDNPCPQNPQILPQPRLPSGGSGGTRRQSGPRCVKERAFALDRSGKRFRRRLLEYSAKDPLHGADQEGIITEAAADVPHR